MPNVKTLATALTTATLLYRMTATSVEVKDAGGAAKKK